MRAAELVRDDSLEVIRDIRGDEVVPVVEMTPGRSLLIQSLAESSAGAMDSAIMYFTSAWVFSCTRGHRATGGSGVGVGEILVRIDGDRAEPPVIPTQKCPPRLGSPLVSKTVLPAPDAQAPSSPIDPRQSPSAGVTPGSR